MKYLRIKKGANSVFAFFADATGEWAKIRNIEYRLFLDEETLDPSYKSFYEKEMLFNAIELKNERDITTILLSLKVHAALEVIEK